MRDTKRRYKTVALGGTFDQFHRGHEELLSKAFDLSEKVLIGITSDKLVDSLGKTHPVEAYSRRASNIKRFLLDRGWARRAEMHRLANPFGPTATRKNLQAIILTSNTLPNGRRLNRERRRRGLTPLVLHTITLANAKDGKTISSTRIRNREIDRAGKILHKRSQAKKNTEES